MGEAIILFMKHLLPISLLAFFFLSLLTVLKVAQPPPAGSISISREAVVSVSIGEPLLTLFGYTAPNALVEASGIGVLAQTRSNEKGYFEFTTIFAFPATREICLSSVDNRKQESSPVCLPMPSFTALKRNVGPVILPPTINLAKGKFLPRETIAASGQSIPNTQLTVSLFRAEPTFPATLTRIVLVKDVLADSLPVYTVKTDQNGNFSFNLPSTTANTFRLFSQTSFNNSPSPKSNTLTFRVLSVFEYFWERLRLFLWLLLNFLQNLPFFETLIFLQLIFLVLLWYRRKKHQLMIIHREIAKQDLRIKIYE